MTKKRTAPRKKKPIHRCWYYEARLKFATSIDEVVDLVDEAAKQPKRIISEKEFEKIYWLGQERIADGCKPDPRYTDVYEVIRMAKKGA